MPNVELVEVDVWVLVDEEGQSWAGLDPAGFDDAPGAEVATRLVKLTVKVPLPRPAVAVVTVPDLPDDAAVTLG